MRKTFAFISSFVCTACILCSSVQYLRFFVVVWYVCLFFCLTIHVRNLVVENSNVRLNRNLLFKAVTLNQPQYTLIRFRFYRLCECHEEKFPLFFHWFNMVACLDMITAWSLISTDKQHVFKIIPPYLTHKNDIQTNTSLNYLKQ